MRAETVLVRRQGGVAELVFNRPEVLNAENWQLAEDFHAALGELEAEAGLEAVVVSGQGRAFCSGVDLKALAAGELKIDWFESIDHAVRRLEQLAAVTIAKIRGYAIGGGLQIALACDLRVAAPDARLGLPAVHEALIPGMGTYRLPQFIGLGRARRMALTGELVPAKEALRIGLVDWVAPEDKLDERIAAVIAETRKGGATARALSKELVTAALGRSYEAALRSYLEFQARALEAGEHKQAMAAYRTRKR